MCRRRVHDVCASVPLFDIIEWNPNVGSRGYNDIMIIFCDVRPLIRLLPLSWVYFFLLLSAPKGHAEIIAPDRGLLSRVTNGKSYYRRCVRIIYNIYVYIYICRYTYAYTRTASAAVLRMIWLQLLFVTTGARVWVYVIYFRFLLFSLFSFFFSVRVYERFSRSSSPFTLKRRIIQYRTTLLLGNAIGHARDRPRGALCNVHHSPWCML